MNNKNDINANNALQLVNLTKTFKTVHAVDNLNLTVPHGSVYGFLGRNGAGKTTTLKMITGLSKPTSGEIYIYGGKSEFGSTQLLKNVGYLPDVPEYYSYMTATEYLYLCGRLHGMADAEINTRISEIFEIIYLDKKRLKSKVSTFSRGMKQKLGIAASLLHSPQLILLDEPTSALDPIGRKETIDIIQSLKGRYTVIFSTHILNDIERVCDKIALIEQGRLILDGSIQELKEKRSANIGGSIVVALSDDSGNFADFLNKVDALDCIRDTVHEKSGENAVSVSFKTDDAGKAGIDLPKIISECGLSLVKFSLDETKLEDIFISATTTSDTENTANIGHRSNRNNTTGKGWGRS